MSLGVRGRWVVWTAVVCAAGSPLMAAEPKIGPVVFDGIEPGVSTVVEVQQAWNKPTKTAQRSGILYQAYAREPFERVSVAFHKGKVLSMTVRFREAFPPAAIVEQLQIGDVEAVLVPDETGEWIGLAYPERGVLFRFSSRAGANSRHEPSGDVGAAVSDAPAAERPVREIILETIDAETFVLRAEARRARDAGGCLSDLAAALSVDAEFVPAYGLRARVLAELGLLEEALAAAAEALRRDPRNAEYRLVRGRALAGSGAYEQAVDESERAWKLSGDRPELAARALLQLGDLAADGPARDYQQAVDFHRQAMHAAAPLVHDVRAAVRRSAKQTLIEAHLAIAGDIAWGNWNHKDEAVAQWLERARTLADAASLAGDLGDEAQLLACARALAACAGAPGGCDPSAWARQTSELGQRQIRAARDERSRRRWQSLVGLALYDALQAFDERHDTEPALEYGSLAASYLEAGAEGRAAAPGDAYRLGRLYFRLGSLCDALPDGQAAAIAWFDKAVPLLEQPLDKATQADVGRQGHSLVAAAVTYWNAGEHAKAVQLTDRGVRFLEQAVAAGLRSRESLAVPYANLAAMHEFLGDDEAARSYADQASQADARSAINAER